MITLRASFKLTKDYIPSDSDQLRSSRHEDDKAAWETSQHSSPERPEVPPGEVQVDDSFNDDVYTAYTAPSETPPPGKTYPTRGTHYRDDDTVTREKKANAVDVD